MEDEFVIRWEIDEISKLTDKSRYSPFVYHRNIPWRLKACTESSERTNNVPHFSLYLCCHEDNDSDLWSVERSSILSLVHRRDASKNINYTRVSSFSKGKQESGKAAFIKFAKRLDSKHSKQQRFVKNDTIIVEVRTTVTAIHCIREKMYLDFFQPLPLGDNVAVKLEDGELHVCRRYLMWHSPYFASLFFGDFKEKDQKVVEIKGVYTEDFNELLQVIFPSERPINVDTYWAILSLADRFQIERALDLVEKYLMRTKQVKMVKKIMIAEEYRFESLMKHSLNTFKTPQELKKLQSTPEFSQMLVSTKVAMLNRAFELVK